MCKEGNCQWDLTYQQIIREQPALQDILPGARSSSQLRHKLVSITKWPKAEGLLLLILSELVWASVMHLSILWCIYLHYYSFLSLQRRTRAGFKQSLNLRTFSRNLVAAYTPSVLPGILQILIRFYWAQWLLLIRGVPLQQMACAITVPCFHLSLHFQVFYAEFCGWKANLSKEMIKRWQQVYFFLWWWDAPIQSIYTFMLPKKKKKDYYDKRIWIIYTTKKISLKCIYFEINKNIICIYSSLY